MMDFALIHLFLHSIFLAENGISANALPAHKSVTTQVLDWTVFPSFNSHSQNILTDFVQSSCLKCPITKKFDVEKNITHAYQRLLKKSIIYAVSHASGVVPF